MQSFWKNLNLPKKKKKKKTSATMLGGSQLKFNCNLDFKY